MGLITHLVILHRLAFALLLGFTLVAFVSLTYLSGRGKHGHYDGAGIGPFESYADWVREGHGPVPLFLKLWIATIIGITVSLTGIVIYHGYHY